MASSSLIRPTTVRLKGREKYNFPVLVMSLSNVILKKKISYLRSLKKITVNN